MGAKMDMSMRRPLFGGADSAAEFVTLGHPDKACDQIAARILDQALAVNNKAHVAIEMVACNGAVHIGGEVSPDNVRNEIDFRSIPDEVFRGMGYDHDPYLIKDVVCLVKGQSKDIGRVEEHEAHIPYEKNEVHIGAGDQGVMNGYAMYAPERNHMPAAFWYAQQLALRLWEITKNKTIAGLYADGKTQVIITDGKINHVTIAIHHNETWNTDKKIKVARLTDPIYEEVIKPVTGSVPSFIVNGTGNFENGSIWADSAEVGRKIVVDQMGPDIPVGGGTLNGKDPSKVDLTATVMARHIAKNIVDNKLADEALVQFAFTIGQEKPDKVIVFAPGWKHKKLSPDAWVSKHFPLTVSGMIEHLGLRDPQGWSFAQTARFGFYGHNQFPWEKTTKMEE